MKKTITVINLFFVLTFFGQTKIYETELSKDKTRRVDCIYSQKQNKIIVNSSINSKSYAFNNSIIIDENANVVNLVDGETFTSLYYSDTDGSYYIKDLLGYYKPANYNFYANNEVSKLTKKITIEDEDYLNKERLIYLTGEKDDVNVNIEKDNLYFNIFDYKKNNIKKIKIEKPDYKRLKGDDKYNLKGDGYLSKDHPSSISTNYFNDKFEIYTKTIFKDKNKAIIYRTIYNDIGKIEKEIEYNVSIDNFTFGNMLPVNSYSKNRDHTESSIYVIGIDKYTYRIPIKDLDINDFFIDYTNSDFYVYGIFLNDKDEPSGFYIQKFSFDGTLIWKKMYDVLDDEDFNRQHNANFIVKFWKETGIALQQSFNDSELVLNLKGEASGSDRYYNYYVIDKSNGNLIDKNQTKPKVDYDGMRKENSYGLTYYYTPNKNINLSDNGYLAYNLNDKIKKHIDSYSKPKDDFYFDAIISSKGIWLIETDNKTKYSITLYK